VILTSMGLHRQVACTALQRQFERLCPGGTARGARVVYDVTGGIFNMAAEEERGPTAAEQAERYAMGARQAAQLSAEYGGFGSCDVFDLAAPDFDAAAYARAVREADVYYCDVGNTWALLYYLRLRGALDAPDGVAARVRRGELLYVGNSAGAICAGRSVETALWKNWDDRWGWQKGWPAHARVNWDDPAVCRAMDIAGGASIFPHYAAKYIKVCEERTRELGHKVLCCANGHGVIIESGIAILVSPEGVAPHIPMC